MVRSVVEPSDVSPETGYPILYLPSLRRRPLVVAVLR